MKQIIILITSGTISISVFAQTTIDSIKKWSYHFQLTAINQTHPSFNAKYSGDNSLNNVAEHKKLSLTTTLFLDGKLWKNGTLYFNPEIAGGAEDVFQRRHGGHCQQPGGRRQRHAAAIRSTRANHPEVGIEAGLDGRIRNNYGHALMNMSRPILIVN